MSSQIDISTIDETYPIAGQDNNSQGFRENFAAIKTAIDYAKTEIEQLQTLCVLKSQLDSTDPANNDLASSTVYNGSYNTFYATSDTTTLTAGSVILVDLRNGDSQTFILNSSNTDDVSVSFTNWPEDNLYAKVRLQIKNNQVASRDIGLFTTTGGPEHIYLHEDLVGTTITLDSSTDSYKVFEAWSNDNGNTVFVQYLGKYNASAG